MAIYNTPYDTTAGLGYRYVNMAHELRTALAGGGLAIHAAVDGQFSHPMHAGASAEAKKFQIALVQGGNSFADSVHFFKHPVFVLFDEQEYICVDVREYGKWEAHQQRFAVRNVPEYIWALKRALLTCIWNDGRVEVLRDISNLPAQVYCALISESISRRFSLDVAEQSTIAVIAGYFYYGLFSNDGAVGEDEKNNLAGKLSRITNVDATRVFSIIDRLGPMPNVAAFCDATREQVGNVALENLNNGNLFNVVGGTWFGTNARDTLCMSLEHVPTWTMIVEASLASQTYKRATLSKISARFDKRQAGEAFSQSLSALLGGPQAIEGLEIYHDFFGSA
jgi:hypothetical protein